MMTEFNGTLITAADRRYLEQNGGTLVDGFKHSAGVEGYALSSGVRFYDTPKGTVLEQPQSMAAARRLLEGRPSAF